MKKFIIIFVILTIIIGGIVLLSHFLNKKPNSSNYNTTRTLAENTTNNITVAPPTPLETEIASYTTKIRTKYPERQTNISLTCNTLNDTIVKSGATFSFNDTVGKATKSKGYEEANVFQDGEEISALGGGKCQVSSTLYNAVLQIPELEIIERHPHSGKVYYVPEGKDAAVSFGSYDFSFKNNTYNDLKIKAVNTEDELKITLLKIE